MPNFFDIKSHDGSTTLAATVNATSLTINPTNITYIQGGETYTINISGLVGLASIPNSDVVSRGAHLGATLSMSDLSEWDDGTGTGTAYVIDNYRLLTSNDLGKTFGTDLENLVYLDNNYFNNNPLFASEFTILNMNYNSLSGSIISHSWRGYYSIYVGDTSTSYYDDFFTNMSAQPIMQDMSGSPDWYYTELTANNGVSISYIDTTNSGWFYVKDMPPTPEQQFNTDMNDLCNIIKDKASTTGQKTIAQMKSAVDGMAKVITVSTLPESADYGVIAIIEEVE